MGFFENLLSGSLEEPIKEKEEEDMEEDNTYEMEWECDNCADNESYDIPKGTKVEDFIKDKICEVCGCKLKE